LLTIFGRSAVEKARRCGEIVIDRVRRAGYDLERYTIECLGSNAVALDVLPEKTDLLETVLRISVADSRREAIDRFSKELFPLVTAGPQGATGYSAGRPHARPVFGYWPCLIQKNKVQPTIQILNP
jgi:hypothetical protein